MNAAEVAIALRPLALTDEPLLRQWLNTPHVAQWWGDAETELREALSHIGSLQTQAFILQGNGHDIGYAQAYDARDDSYFADRPAGAKGMDLYLGYADLVGKGLGTRIIQGFSEKLLAEGAVEVVADPVPSNSAAFTAYKKAGFMPYRVHRSAAHGHLILMSKTLKTA